MSLASALGFTLFGMLAGALLLARLWFASMSKPGNIVRMFVGLGESLRRDPEQVRRERFLSNACPLCGPTSRCPACGRAVLQPPIPVEIPTDSQTDVAPVVVERTP